MSSKPAYVLAALIAITTLAAHGQVLINSSEQLDFDRPEAWAMKYFASLSLMTGMGAARSIDAGSIELGVELGSVPSLSRTERTVGFNGTKEEDINRTSIFGRMRIVVGLANDFSLEATYLPPIDISGVEPSLYGLALARPLSQSDRWRTSARLTAQDGNFSGDFTCSADEIRNGSNNFQCEEPSRDEISIRTASLELATARRAASERWESYFSLGLHTMDLEFEVRAEYLGLIDRGTLSTDGTTYSATLGLAYFSETQWRWSAELFYSPLDVVRPPAISTETDALLNLRFMFGYAIR